MGSTNFATRALTPDRQYPLVGVVRFDWSKLEAGVNDLLSIPGNAIVTGGAVIVQTAWDSGTTATLDIGNSEEDDEYTGTAVDLTTVGITQLDVTGYQYPTPDVLIGTFAETGDAAEAGEALLYVEYIIEGRGGEIQ